MLSIYGPTLAEQVHFLTEYQANLGLFHAVKSDATKYELADLLACSALPAHLATSFKGYDQAIVERMKAYGRSALQELEADFARDGNPVHAWGAFVIARTYENDTPEWVLNFVYDVARGILDICGEVSQGKPAIREAERVGKVLGFGTDGRGRGGWFKRATMLHRDRTIYFKVGSKLKAGMKRNFAYDDVAKTLNVSRSTIVRAYLRITSGSLVASAFIQRVDLSCCFSDRMADLVAIDPLG